MSDSPTTKNQGDEQVMDIQGQIAEISKLVQSGLLAQEHQLKIADCATTASAKIDELRTFLDSHFRQGWAILGGPPPPPQPARQKVVDSMASTILQISRMQSLFSSLSDEGQDEVQKLISTILGRLMSVLDDFKKHLDYQNWGISFGATFPWTIQVGVQITFQ